MVAHQGEGPGHLLKGQGKAGLRNDVFGAKALEENAANRLLPLPPEAWKGALPPLGQAGTEGSCFHLDGSVSI